MVITRSIPWYNHTMVYSVEDGIENHTTSSLWIFKTSYMHCCHALTSSSARLSCC